MIPSVRFCANPSGATSHQLGEEIGVPSPKLVDVAPDGFAQNLTEGIIRARYRNSQEKAELINPGQIYKFVIDLWSTSNVFLKGHALRLEISSKQLSTLRPESEHRRRRRFRAEVCAGDEYGLSRCGAPFGAHFAHCEVSLIRGIGR